MIDDDLKHTVGKIYKPPEDDTGLLFLLKFLEYAKRIQYFTSLPHNPTTKNNSGWVASHIAIVDTQQDRQGSKSGIITVKQTVKFTHIQPARVDDDEEELYFVISSECNKRDVCITCESAVNETASDSRNKMPFKGPVMQLKLHSEVTANEQISFFNATKFERKGFYGFTVVAQKTIPGTAAQDSGTKTYKTTLQIESYEMENKTLAITDHPSYKVELSLDPAIEDVFNLGSVAIQNFLDNFPYAKSRAQNSRAITKPTKHNIVNFVRDLYCEHIKMVLVHDPKKLTEMGLNPLIDFVNNSSWIALLPISSISSILTSPLKQASMTVLAKLSLLKPTATETPIESEGEFGQIILDELLTNIYPGTELAIQTIFQNMTQIDGLLLKNVLPLLLSQGMPTIIKAFVELYLNFDSEFTTKFPLITDNGNQVKSVELKRLYEDLVGRGAIYTGCFTQKEIDTIKKADNKHEINSLIVLKIFALYLIDLLIENALSGGRNFLQKKLNYEGLMRDYDIPAFPAELLALYKDKLPLLFEALSHIGKRLSNTDERHPLCGLSLIVAAINLVATRNLMTKITVIANKCTLDSKKIEHYVMVRLCETKSPALITLEQFTGFVQMLKGAKLLFGGLNFAVKPLLVLPSASRGLKDSMLIIAEFLELFINGLDEQVFDHWTEVIPYCENILSDWFKAVVMGSDGISNHRSKGEKKFLTLTNKATIVQKLEERIPKYIQSWEAEYHGTLVRTIGETSANPTTIERFMWLAQRQTGSLCSQLSACIAQNEQFEKKLSQYFKEIKGIYALRTELLKLVCEILNDRQDDATSASKVKKDLSKLNSTINKKLNAISENAEKIRALLQKNKTIELTLLEDVEPGSNPVALLCATALTYMQTKANGRDTSADRDVLYKIITETESRQNTLHLYVKNIEKKLENLKKDTISYKKLFERLSIIDWNEYLRDYMTMMYRAEDHYIAGEQEMVMFRALGTETSYGSTILILDRIKPGIIEKLLTIGTDHHFTLEFLDRRLTFNSPLALDTQYEPSQQLALPTMSSHMLKVVSRQLDAQISSNTQCNHTTTKLSIKFILQCILSSRSVPYIGIAEQIPQQLLTQFMLHEDISFCEFASTLVLKLKKSGVAMWVNKSQARAVNLLFCAATLMPQLKKGDPKTPHWNIFLNEVKLYYSPPQSEEQVTHLDFLYTQKHFEHFAKIVNSFALMKQVNQNQLLPDSQERENGAILLRLRPIDILIMQEQRIDLVANEMAKMLSDTLDATITFVRRETWQLELNGLAKTLKILREKGTETLIEHFRENSTIHSALYKFGSLLIERNAQHDSAVLMSYYDKFIDHISRASLCCLLLNLDHKAKQDLLKTLRASEVKRLGDNFPEEECLITALKYSLTTQTELYGAAALQRKDIHEHNTAEHDTAASTCVADIGNQELDNISDFAITDSTILDKQAKCDPVVQYSCIGCLIVLGCATITSSAMCVYNLVHSLKFGIAIQKYSYILLSASIFTMIVVILLVVKMLLKSRTGHEKISEESRQESDLIHDAKSESTYEHKPDLYDDIKPKKALEETQEQTTDIAVTEHVNSSHIDMTQSQETSDEQSSSSLKQQSHNSSVLDEDQSTINLARKGISKSPSNSLLEKDTLDSTAHSKLDADKPSNSKRVEQQNTETKTNSKQKQPSVNAYPPHGKVKVTLKQKLTNLLQKNKKKSSEAQVMATDTIQSTTNLVGVNPQESNGASVEQSTKLDKKQLPTRGKFLKFLKKKKPSETPAIATGAAEPTTPSVMTPQQHNDSSVIDEPSLSSPIKTELDAKKKKPSETPVIATGAADPSVMVSLQQNNPSVRDEPSLSSPIKTELDAKGYRGSN